MKYNFVKLGDICDFAYGDGLKEINRKGGNFPVYGSNGIVGWHEKPLTKGETIIVGRKGSIGEVHLSKVPCWPIDTTYYIEKTKVPCNFTWLYYMLLALNLTRLNKSAAVPGLNRDDAYEQKLPLPPLPEQRRIAALLLRADRQRRLRRVGDSLSASLLQSVFLEMFGDPVRNEKHWQRATIADLGKVQTGNTPSREELENFGGFIEWIKSDNILGSQLYISQSREMLSEIGFKKGRSVNAGAVLITCIAGSLSHVGDVAITNRKVSFNQQINAISPNPDVNSLFLYGMLNMAKPYVQYNATVGMKHIITKSKLEDLVLIKPPLPEQERFAQVVRRVESLRRRQAESARQAEGLFQSLLSQCFGG
jgi:type I restriction enzyme, S subunit